MSYLSRSSLSNHLTIEDHSEWFRLRLHRQDTDSYFFFEENKFSTLNQPQRIRQLLREGTAAFIIYFRERIRAE